MENYGTGIIFLPHLAHPGSWCNPKYLPICLLQRPPSFNCQLKIQTTIKTLCTIFTGLSCVDFVFSETTPIYLDMFSYKSNLDTTYITNVDIPVLQDLFVHLISIINYGNPAIIHLLNI